MQDQEAYFAHSENGAGVWNPLANHLRDVSSRARKFAEAFGLGESAYVAGILHDLGKYGDLFQKRLRGQESGLDHWTAGASVCLERFKSQGIAPALAIQGHHLGLQWWTKDELVKLVRLEIEGRRLTECKLQTLLERFQADGLSLPDSIYAPAVEAKTVAAMLDVRMLFSALVDADYLATEEHFAPAAARMREPAAELRPDQAEEILNQYLAALGTKHRSSEAVAAVRADLMEACRAAGEKEPGLFTLTAPTGSGKTLSTLAFGLRHARRYGLRRIVIVLPFLSIIDQTVRVYRDALAEIAAQDRYLLEHHSLAMEQAEGEDNTARLRGMLAENWDAPVVITTSVQLLESLFSNSPSACRKLHRLAQSVVVFDEVQTLPLKTVVPTLAALSRLAERYRATVVFSTATQPAFMHLDQEVRAYCTSGWNPREIAPADLQLFKRLRRVRVSWPTEGERLTWEGLAERFKPLNQALCVVNLKKHAREIFGVLRNRREDQVFHLSTAMCPKHRGAVLAMVRQRLDNSKPCFLVATQCVEAGVDLDFPAVFRALGPLDSIAQAAGRCNRNGKLNAGDLHVFLPQDSRYPQGAYRQAAELTEVMLRAEKGLSIDDPAHFEEYFRSLYQIAELDHGELIEAINSKCFVEVRKHYRVIDQDTVNVLVAYDPETHGALAEEARTKGLTRDWIRRARPHAVSWFRREVEKAFVEPACVRERGGKLTASGDWFIYLRDQHYDPEVGLVLPKELEFLEA